MYTETQTYVPSLFNLANALNASSDVYMAPTSAADNLCEDLLDHTLECTICLQSWNSQCSEYRRIENQIQALGGANKGIMLAI